MALGNRAYFQKATYWSSPTQGGFGNITFDAPRVIMVRWEDRIEEFVDLAGSEHKSKAIVYSLEDLEIGGYLMKGESEASDPTSVSGAHKIQRTDTITDLRGLHEEHRNFL